MADYEEQLTEGEAQPGDTSAPDAMWTCQCGEQFEDPRDLGGHFFSAKRTDPDAVHGAVGLVDNATGEVLMKWGPHIWRKLGISGKSETTRRARAMASEPSEATWEVITHEDGTQEEVPRQRTRKPNQSGRPAYSVRVQYRPRVFELDESVVYLYHLFLQSARNLGLAVSEADIPFGQWIRDCLFQHFMEHPEVIDLRTMLTEEEQERLRQGPGAELELASMGEGAHDNR